MTSTFETWQQRFQAIDELGFKDPSQALIDAQEACEQVAALVVESDEPTTSVDSNGWHLLQAEAWACLAAAHRGVGNVPEAESHLRLALAFVDGIAGGVEPQIWARLAQRASYVRCSQGRIEEAIDLSRDARRLFGQAGRPAEAWAAQVDHALFLGRSGRLEPAVGLLEQCLEHLDAEAQPRAYLSAVHNLAFYHLQLAVNEPSRLVARHWLERARQVHEKQPHPLAWLKLLAMDGLNELRFGERREGEAILWRAYDGFSELGARPMQLLVLLYLADSALTQDDDGDQLTGICGSIFPLLKELQLPAETRRSVLGLLNAANDRRLTAEWVRRVTAQVQSAIAA